jgi:hypothetical protein
MLHRDKREIVNTCNHLTNRGDETLAADQIAGAHCAPEKYCTTCANVAVQKF